MTSVDIDSGTIGGITIDGNWTAAGQTCANLGTVTTASISAFKFNGSTVSSGSCFEINTLITLKDGSTKKYGELLINDEIKSLNIDGIPDSDDPYVYLNIELTSITATDTISKVINKTYDSVNNYFLINETIKVTGEHVLFIKRDTIWKYRRVWQIQQHDKMYDINKNEVNIASITEVPNTWIDVCIIDVEDVDNYFAANILSHNPASNKLTLS